MSHLNPPKAFPAWLTRQALARLSAYTIFCVTLLMWARSFLVSDEFMFSHSNASAYRLDIFQLILFPSNGQFEVSIHQSNSVDFEIIDRVSAAPPDGFAHFTYRPEYPPRLLQLIPRYSASFRPSKPEHKWETKIRTLEIPYWMLATATGIFPLKWIVSGMRSKR